MSPLENFLRKLSRREALVMLGAAAGAAVVTGCGESAGSPTSPTTTTTTPTGGNASCAVSPLETIGPFPSMTDLMRSDIREDRSGTTLNLMIAVVNANNGCSPVANAVVDVWQCDANGDYSQYGTQRAETFLRGIQTTDSSGRVSFTTIYPGWYAGRATHIHVEVTVNGQSVKVTQIAFPEETTSAVYATGVYASRGQNPTSNTRDGIFADSLASELASVTGNAASGYEATFTVGISV